jgi:type IV secretory pathway VirJ component
LKRLALAALLVLAGCSRITVPLAGEGSGTRTLPARVLPVAAPGRAMAVVLTGDGPVAGLADRLARDIRAAGVPVVVWSSTRYYWTPRTPDEASGDLDRVIRHYGAAWKRERVLVVGYSMGADVAPFLINRLPPATRARVGAAALIAMAHDAVFEFHVHQWWGPSSAPSLATRPEIERLRSLRIVCIHGRGDRFGACPEMKTSGMAVVELRGGHHFRGDGKRLSRVVVDLAKSVEGAADR